MRRFTLSAMVASLMVLGGAAQAQDRCDILGDYTEAGLCSAYCAAMDCDLIGDGDPISSPQASEAACRNVAVSFFSFLTGVPQRDVNPVEAMDMLDNDFCSSVCPLFQCYRYDGTK